MRAGGEVSGEMAERDEPTGALVRPYAVTRGRTRRRLDIAMEALIETTVRGRTAGSRPGGNGQEQQYIVTMCDGRVQSLAEIAARLHLPLGVARVLIADMATEGLVEDGEQVRRPEVDGLFHAEGGWRCLHGPYRGLRRFRRLSARTGFRPLPRHITRAGLGARHLSGDVPHAVGQPSGPGRGRRA